MSTITLVLGGLLTGIGLIAAVGAQNAYLLRQGLRRQHVAPLVALCALSDIVLIGAAVLDQERGLLDAAVVAARCEEKHRLDGRGADSRFFLAVHQYRHQQ